jgi:hypothetical protein
LLGANIRLHSLLCHPGKQLTAAVRLSR